MSDHPTTAIRAGDVGSEGRYRFSGPTEWPHWRCPDCGCRSHARINEQKPDHRFGPGPLIRCVECKSVFDTRSPAPSQDRAGDGGDLGELERLSEAASPGIWSIWPEKILNADDAIVELTEQVERTRPIGSHLFLLNADGKCPATTGCGPCSEANAAFIVALVNAYRSGKLLPSIQGQTEAGTGETFGPGVLRWRHPSEAPDNRPVLVAGGVGYRRDGTWYSITGEEWPGRPIQWEVLAWAELPSGKDVEAASSGFAAAIPSRGRFIDGVEDLPAEEDMTERGMSALPDSIRYDIEREARNLVNVFVPDAPPALLQGIKAALFRAEKRRIADLKRERASGFAAAIPSGGTRDHVASARLIPWEPGSLGGVDLTFESGLRVALPLTGSVPVPAGDNAEWILRAAWPEFGGNQQTAEYWSAFSDAVNFTLASLGRAPASADGNPTGEDAHGAAESRSDASAVGRKAEAPDLNLHLQGSDHAER